jgi:hypothetical protein
MKIHGLGQKQPRAQTQEEGMMQKQRARPLEGRGVRDKTLGLHQVRLSFTLMLALALAQKLHPVGRSDGHLYD